MGKSILVEVLPSITQCDSWAKDKIGQRFLVKSSGNNYIVVGSHPIQYLPKRHVTVIGTVTEINPDTTPIEDCSANILV